MLILRQKEYALYNNSANWKVEHYKDINGRDAVRRVPGNNPATMFKTGNGVTGMGSDGKVSIGNVKSNAILENNLAKQQSIIASTRAKNVKALAGVDNSAIANIANKARQQGYNNGLNAASQTSTNVGMLQGMKNTWNNAGVGGKIAMGTAAAGTALLAAKGIGSLFNRKKKKDDND